MQTEQDWRRLTWARYWLTTVALYEKNARDLRACGSQALSFVLASLGRDEAARATAHLKPGRSDGFSLAELQTLARRHGLRMQGFGAQVADLPLLPVPFIAHLNSARKSEVGTRNVPTRQEKLARVAWEGKADDAGGGHFVVVRRVEAKRKRAHIYDPQGGRRYTLSFAQLGREWSGRGLMLAATPAERGKAIGVKATGGKAGGNKAGGNKTGPVTIRVASLQSSKLSSSKLSSSKLSSSKLRLSKLRLSAMRLSAREMRRVVGGAMVGLAAQPLMGEPEGGSGADTSGMDGLETNLVNANVHIEDSALWYSSAKGPDVEISLAYSLQDASTGSRPFGNKRLWSYGTYVKENSDGSATLFMPDGTQNLYRSNGAGGYTSEVGVFNTLVKTGTLAYELTFPGGSKFVYGVPAGTTATQPFLVQARDAWGYALSFGYDANVRLTTITDALNRVTTLTYNASGRVTRMDDPFGRFATCTYDAGGNLTQVVDMGGSATGYVYDSSVRVTQRLLPQGTWLFYHEGPDGGMLDEGEAYPPPGGSMGPNSRLTITDPLGQKEEYFRDAAANQTWHVAKRHYVAYTSTYNNASAGVPKEYFTSGVVIDGKGKITQDAAPPSGTSSPSGSQSYAYDPGTGQKNRVTDERGKITSASYNAWGRATTVTDPKGAITRLYYAANGRDLSSAQNALGQTVVTATYNAQHQPLTVTDALNNVTSFTYTAWGAPLTMTDAQGKVTSYDYNTGGLLTQVRRGTAVLASFTYDALGRVATQTDAAGLTLSYSYDNLDQVTRVTWPDATSSSTVYLPGQRGLASSRTDRAGRTQTFTYDALDRATGTQDAANRTTGFSYDADDNRTGLRDAANTLTSWSYDNLGRVTAKSYAGGAGDAFFYDAAGNLTSRRDAQNRSTSYLYDDNENLTLVDYPAGAAAADVSFVYDALNRVTQMTDGLGTTAYVYDVLNRVTSADGPLTNDTLTYAYDSLGRRSGLGVQGAAANVSYGYDTLDRLSSIGSAAGTWGYNYSGNSGLLTQLTRPNGSSSSFSYDGLQRLTGVGNRKADASLISGYNYGYDNRDVKTFVERQVGAGALQRVNYTYDTVDQLTLERSTEQTPLVNNAFAYDTRGNRSSSTGTTGTVSYTPNALNQVTSYSTTGFGTNTLSYDADGNLTSNAKGVGGTTYSYDEENRLTRITGVNETTGVNERKSEFVYDGQSRKVISREFTWNGTAWVQQSETRRVYDGMDVVQERDGSNAVTANYTRSGNIGGLLARSTSSGHFYYHYDGSGNVMQLTDAAQATVADYKYDAYGNLLSSSGTQAGQPYRYSTKEYHSDSGLYDYGYRFYSPGLGRWVNRDPIEEDGGINLYGFVANNPINNWDEHGLTYIYIEPPMPIMGSGPWYQDPRVPAWQKWAFWGGQELLFATLPGGRGGGRGFYRPIGTPKSWPAKPVGKGMKWSDPKNPHNSVRVMPGDPNSPYPNSQKPYVRMQKEGSPLDKNGNKLPTKKSEDAHIPRKGFKVNPNWFKLTE